MENTIKKKKFLLNELLLIAMIAACGTAVKVIVGVLVRTLTASIGIPGGAIAGGFYMLWLALGVGLIKKFGTATFISLIQSLMVFLGGLPGSHGIVTFLTYMIPAVLVDIVFLFSKNKNFNILHYLIATMLANIAGTYGTNLVFFRLPLIPLFMVLSASMLSGALGGVLAYLIIKKINFKPHYVLENKTIDNEKSENKELKDKDNILDTDKEKEILKSDVNNDKIDNDFKNNIKND